MEGLEAFAAFAATYVSVEDMEAHNGAVASVSTTHAWLTRATPGESPRVTRARSQSAKSMSTRCGRAPWSVMGCGWRPRVSLGFPAVDVDVGAGRELGRHRPRWGRVLDTRQSRADRARLAVPRSCSERVNRQARGRSAPLRKSV